ncbi:MAG TPA: pyridoxal-dependent decarboxylase [Caulobacteraceae bacterium]|nr:pyridoxal-dependent decarboxylase [Caulobacteraceae bacterium]
MTVDPPSLAPDLDPSDWPAARAQAHRMLDDMLDHMQGVGEGPVWRPAPAAVRDKFAAPLPCGPQPLEAVHEEFRRTVLPYGVGNAHPRFFGWVHGGGTVVGMLAEMLAAGLNANLGGRDQTPVLLERQVARWMAELFGFPSSASGLFVTGASMANLIAVLVARADRLGAGSRQSGAGVAGAKLRAYASGLAHSCIAKAMDMAGLGSNALRSIPVDAMGRMDLAALAAAVANDKADGLEPFLLIGTAGSVDTGSIDDLAALAQIASEQRLWLHVDGAFGALAKLSPDLAPLLDGIERADSIAFDFHKWGQAPYDAGFVMVRDGDKHQAAFATTAAYLRREAKGLAAGAPWPCDFGPDLSRGFRALKVWFAFKTYGAEAIGATILNTCRLGAYLAARVDAEPELERLAPAPLNIVCLRYRGPDPDHLNSQIVLALQTSGVAAPSTTLINGALAIRVAIVNHRTRAADIDLLIAEVLRLGRSLSRGHAA